MQSSSLALARLRLPSGQTSAQHCRNITATQLADTFAAPRKKLRHSQKKITVTMDRKCRRMPLPQVIFESVFNQGAISLQPPFTPATISILMHITSRRCLVMIEPANMADRCRRSCRTTHSQPGALDYAKIFKPSLSRKCASNAPISA